MSKEKKEYLKFKPFADDLRKAESWCELDGVLNRYQTVKNLSKMGYRKQSEGEWIVEGSDYIRRAKCSKCGHEFAVQKGMLQLQKFPYCPHCGAKMKGGE